jgi:hypothetical protein
LPGRRLVDLTAVAIHRLPGPPRVILSGLEGNESLFEVLLTAIPSPEWRAAFVRPPGRLTGVRYAPDVGRVTVQKAGIHFRTAPAEVDGWLRRLDRWIAYANSVVEE